MRVALVTTCRNRLAHLSQTLPQNLIDRGDHRDSVFVVLDYNDQEGLGDYIQREHARDLDSGALVYYRTEEPQKFAMAHAKNLAHRCGMIEGGDILVNVDADNYTGEQFSSYVERRFRTAADDMEAIFLGARANHRGPGGLTKVRTPPGTFGRIGVTRQAFMYAGGYDEIFTGWSPDDRDFAARVGNLGFSWRMIHPDYLRAIKHGSGLRFRETGEDKFDEAEVLTSRRDMRIVNAGHIGEAIVRRNFSPEPIEIGRLPTRIFGIGLHKAATTSLARALEMLGYDCAHWPSAHWAMYVYNEMKESGRSRTLEMHMSACDLPIPLLYKELDAAYPGSRFILTIRDEDEWIESVRVHWKALRPTWDGDVFSNECHKLLYGITEFDEAVFRARYRKHNQDVQDYFSGRDNLLLLHINKGTKMTSLCRFLDREPLDWPFPWKHRSAYQAKYKDAFP